MGRRIQGARVHGKKEQSRHRPTKRATRERGWNKNWAALLPLFLSLSFLPRQRPAVPPKRKISYSFDATVSPPPFFYPSFLSFPFADPIHRRANSRSLISQESCRSHFRVYHLMGNERWARLTRATDVSGIYKYPLILLRSRRIEWDFFRKRRRGSVGILNFSEKFKKICVSSSIWNIRNLIRKNKLTSVHQYDNLSHTYSRQFHPARIK